MATYHVMTSGNDGTGDGSLAFPWRTVSFALTQVVSGGSSWDSSPDTIVVHHDPALPFIENVPSVSAKGVKLVAADSSGVRADAAGWDGEYTVIQPASGAAVDPDDYQHWIGFAFDGVNAGSFWGFESAGAPAVWLEDCWNHRWGKGGHNEAGPASRFHRTVFQDLGDRPFWGSNHADIEARACLFLDCGGVYAVGPGVLFENCTAIGCGGFAAIQASGTPGVNTVRNCVALDNPASYGISAHPDNLFYNDSWASSPIYHGSGNYVAYPVSEGFNAEVNPLLDADFRPQLDSQIRNNGDPAATTALDLDQFPFASPASRGALEFQGSAAATVDSSSVEFSADVGGAPVSAEAAAEPMALDRDTLRSAVLASIFSDRRAEDQDTLPAGSDRRGWWADDPTGDAFGSRLWLLDRSVLTDETVALAQTYLLEALEWLVEDGVATRVEVTVDRTPEGISGGIDIVREEGADVQLRFADLWEAMTYA